MKLNLLVIAFILSSVGICTSESECPEQIWYQDLDGDGFGNPNESQVSCEGANGYVLVSGDCDDQNAAINSDAEEIVGNDVDENCNPADDECTELGVFEGDILLRNQTEVNAFAQLCIAQINGKLIIGTFPEDLLDPVVDLSQLKTLTKVGTELTIWNNSGLKTLKGLESLTEIVKGSFGIAYNPQLESLVALKNLSSIKYSLQIIENASLRNLEGLEGLTRLNENTSISNNASLSSLKGLENVQQAMVISIGYNPSLQNLNGFSSLTSILSIQVVNNESLTSLFSSTNQIKEIHNISMLDNPLLSSLEGLSNPNATIDSEITIIGNSSIEDLKGIYPSDSLSSNVTIKNNQSLKSLESLKKIKYIRRTLSIENNDALLSLSGLEELRQVGPTYNIEVRYGLKILDNDKLTDFCAITELISQGVLFIYEVEKNGFNPTKSDFLTGNCKD